MNAGKAAQASAKPAAPVRDEPKTASKAGLTPAECAELNVSEGRKPTKDEVSGDKAMRDYLMAFPPVQIVIPLQPGEKPGVQEMVAVNGVQLWVKKGVMIAIPKPFAEQVMNFTNIQAENGGISNKEIQAGSDKAKALN